MSIYRSQVTIHNSVLGGTGTNTWHLRADGDDIIPDTLAAADAAGALETAYTDLVTLMPGDTELRHNGEWLQVDDETPRALATDSWVVAGGTGESLPPSQCIVIGWKTELAAKSGRGRTFVGPIAESWNDGGTPSDTALTVVRDVADAIIAWNAGFASLAAALGVWSPGTELFHDFTARTVHDKFAFLGSRRD